MCKRIFLNSQKNIYVTIFKNNRSWFSYSRISRSWSRNRCSFRLPYYRCITKSFSKKPAIFLFNLRFCLFRGYSFIRIDDGFAFVICNIIKIYVIIYAIEIIDYFLFNIKDYNKIYFYKSYNSYDYFINKNSTSYKSSKQDSPEDETNSIIKIIIKTIENKCFIYKKIRNFTPDDALWVKFLLEEFATQFVKWQSENSKKIWFNSKAHERWSILRPFWWNYLTQTIYSSKVKNYIYWSGVYYFIDKLKKLPYSFVNFFVPMLESVKRIYARPIEFFQRLFPILTLVIIYKVLSNMDYLCSILF